MTAVRVRDFEMHFDVTGSRAATPFVWGHGLTSSRAIEDAYPILDFGTLARTHQVVRYDARGHGESDLLADPRRGSWLELALDQAALIDHLGLTRIALGGASMGAATALHHALELGDRLERLVLVIPPTAWEERAEQVDMYERMARVVETTGVETLIAASAAMPPPDPFVERDDWAERRAYAYRSTPSERIAANFRGAAHADLPALEAIATIAAPALILAWTGDRGHPMSTANLLAEALPGALLSVASTSDQLDEWTTRCQRFLAGAT